MLFHIRNAECRMPNFQALYSDTAHVPFLDVIWCWCVFSVLTIAFDGMAPHRSTISESRLIRNGERKKNAEEGNTHIDFGAHIVHVCIVRPFQWEQCNKFSIEINTSSLHIYIYIFRYALDILRSLATVGCCCCAQTHTLEIGGLFCQLFECR